MFFFYAAAFLSQCMHRRLRLPFVRTVYNILPVFQQQRADCMVSGHKGGVLAGVLLPFGGLVRGGGASEAMSALSCWWVACACVVL